jgi:hypothetical protein
MVKLLLGEVVPAFLIELRVTLNVWFDIRLDEAFKDLRVTLFYKEFIVGVGLEFNAIPDSTAMTDDGKII